MLSLSAVISYLVAALAILGVLSLILEWLIPRIRAGSQQLRPRASGAGDPAAATGDDDDLAEAEALRKLYLQTVLDAAAEEAAERERQKQAARVLDEADRLDIKNKFKGRGSEMGGSLPIDADGNPVAPIDAVRSTSGPMQDRHDAKAPGQAAAESAIAEMKRRKKVARMAARNEALSSSVQPRGYGEELRQRRTREAADRQALRDAQDREFQAALAADEERDMLAAAEEHRRAIQAERQAVKEAILASLPEEPAADADQTTTVAVNFPNNDRASRRFHLSDTLDFVLDYAFATTYYERSECTAYDVFRKPLGDPGLTLGELGFGRREKIHIEEE